MNSLSRNLQQNLRTLSVVEDLTEVFQNTASVKIRAVRQRVLSSKLFFNDLWNIHQQLRVETRKSISDASANRRQLRVIITGPATFSGGTDERLINQLKSDFVASKHDVLVIGSHGANLLKQANIKPVASFELPDISSPFTIDPIVDVIKTYQSTVAYFESYISLTVQTPQKIDLLTEPQILTDDEKSLIKTGQTEIIAVGNYIFEPSLEVAILTLEQTMLKVTITQLILESGLSQLANRFTTNTLANDRAKRQHRKTLIKFLATRRNERDEANRQITVAARMGRL